MYHDLFVVYPAYLCFMTLQQERSYLSLNLYLKFAPDILTHKCIPAPARACDYFTQTKDARHVLENIQTQTWI